MGNRAAWFGAAIVFLVGPLAASNASGQEEGPMIAFTTNRALNLYRGTVFSIRPDGKRRRMLARGVPGQRDVVRSHDGRRVLFVRSGSLFTARADGTSARQLTPSGIQVVQSLGLAWSPNQRHVAFVSSHRCDRDCVYIVGLDGQKLRSLGPGFGPSWAADSRRIAYTSVAAGRIPSVVIADFGRVVRRLGAGSAPEWAPRGDWIAYKAVNPERPVCFVRANGSGRHCLRGPGGLGFWGNFIWSPDGRRVAFSSSGRIAVGRVHGRFTRTLRHRQNDPEVVEGVPLTWSPDGRRIAYLRLRQIYVRTANGQGRPRRVTSEPGGTAIGEKAVWRNGRITYTALLEANDHELAVMRPNSTGLRILTRNRVDDVQPAWSPDRRAIAFVRVIKDSDGNRRGALRMIRADGTRDRPLTARGDWSDSSPAWSPDGRRIAFVRAEAKRNLLVIIDLARSGLAVIDAAPQLGGGVSWSPNGRFIVFSAQPPPPEERPDLYVVGADGQGLRRLATGCYWALFPSWSPDGRRIAFTGACASPGWGVHTITAEGTGRALIETTVSAGPSTWSPDGTRIVFEREIPSDFGWPTSRLIAARLDGGWGGLSASLTAHHSRNSDPAWGR